MKNNLLSFLSLAKKAGKIKSGESIILEEISSMKVNLLIIASNASDNTKKRYTDKCHYRNIPTIELSCKDELGKAIGKGFAAAVAICDEGFAKSFLEKYGRCEYAKDESLRIS